jgi:hypothetical protein
MRPCLNVRPDPAARSDWPDQVVVDERHRAFFEAVNCSLEQVAAKIDQIDQIEFVANDDEDDANQCRSCYRITIVQSKF